GSTFRLHVPAAAVPVEQSVPAAPPSSVTLIPPVVAAVSTAGAMSLDSRVTNRTWRAVIADDSEDIRTFLWASLRRMGITATMAENGQGAVTMALAEQPDLVLMDVQMPVMNGPEAAQALRRAGFSNLLVALTAGSGEALESDLRAAGFDAVVFKPV